MHVAVIINNTLNTVHDNNMEEITDNLSLQSMPSTSCAINNSDNTFDITVKEFADKIAQSSTLFVANLYSRPSLPRVFCQGIIDSIRNFLNYVKILEEKYKSIEPNPHLDLSAMFNILNNAFTDYSSEYKTMLYFKTMKSLIEPQEICIGAFIDSNLMKTSKQMLVRNRKICVCCTHCIHLISYSSESTILRHKGKLLRSRSIYFPYIPIGNLYL